MDIKQFKKLSNSKIEAGTKTRAVRNELKQYKEAKQDAYEGVSESLQPLLDVEKSVKESIDKKQDELIEQLQRNQQAQTQGFDKVIDMNQRAILFDTELPKAIEDKETKEKEEPTILNIDNAFNKNDRIILSKHKLLLPNELTQISPNKLEDENKKAVQIAKTVGSNKRFAAEKDKKSYNMELETLRKYRETIKDVMKSWKYKTKGQGIYTQKKRNAYKISQNGQYGGLIIDLPKLYGHLKVIAHKNGQKVYDKQADFDTLDLLTKRFNSKKKYSDLSKIIFNELNQISEIPIHRTSNKFKKMGPGVIYYNNPNDLLDRMELLGGSIQAGNDGVKKEFTQIAHTLNKIGVINNFQLNDLLREYLI